MAAWFLYIRIIILVGYGPRISKYVKVTVFECRSAKVKSEVNQNVY